MGHSFREGMGLSGTGTGQDQKGSLDMVDRLFLSFVEHGGSIRKTPRIARDFSEKNKWIILV